MNNFQISSNGQWQTTPLAEGTKIETHGEVVSYGSVDSASSMPYVGDVTPTIGYFQTNVCSCCCYSHYHLYPTKSAREQVIDEILTKMADAVSKDDFKQAKKLAQLAKQVKEL